MSVVGELRFHELLPYWVNGAIGDEDRAFVAAWLAAHPRAQGDVRFATIMREVMLEAEAAPADDAGLERLLHRLRGERATARGGTWRRSRRLARPLLAAAALLVLQAGLLSAFIPRQPPGLEYRGVEPGVAAAGAGASLKLTFKPSTPFAVAMELLEGEDGRIVSGPDETGALTVQFPQHADLGRIRRKLLDSGVIDDIVPLSPKP